MYDLFNFSSESSLILMIAVGPSVVILAVVFIVRLVGGHRQTRPSNGLRFTFVYGVCLLLAAYLFGTLVLEDVVDLSQSLITILSVLLITIILLPVEIYVVTVLIELGYGAHWAIIPAALSELFGLKSFGALYNFLTLSSTFGSLIFSGINASGIYTKQKNRLVFEYLVQTQSLEIKIP